MPTDKNFPFSPYRHPATSSPPFRSVRHLWISSSNSQSLMDMTQFLLSSTGSLSALTSSRLSLLSPHQEPLNSSEIMSGHNMDGPRRSSRIEDNNLPQSSLSNLTSYSASKPLYQPCITRKPTDKPNEPIRNSSNTSESTLTLCKTIGQ